jgi:hypothetical protein
MKEFQQRNKMAMHYLLHDKEKKSLKSQFREEWQDKLLKTQSALGETTTTAFNDAELNNNINTSLFI